MKDLLEKVAVRGAQALGGVVVESVSEVLKNEMTDRKIEEDKIQALDTVTEVCQGMVPDMAGKAVGGLFTEEALAIEETEALTD